MVYQRIHKSSRSNTPSQIKSSQFALRPFAVLAPEDSYGSPTQKQIENEAFGLQFQEKSGAIAPVEQERSGGLPTKMDDLCVQKREKASRFDHDFSKIPVHSPEKQVSGLLQPFRSGVPPQSQQQAIASDRNGRMGWVNTAFAARNTQSYQVLPIPTKLTIGQKQESLQQIRETETSSAAEGGAIQAKSELALDTHQSTEKSHPNQTGLPDALKAGVENLSGYSFNDVRVHYNSPQPAQLQALAYTQGTEIHLAPGQEEHLPHEAWHIVQQMQGRVKPTMQMKGVQINDDRGLEREADVMGIESAKHQFTAHKLSHEMQPAGRRMGNPEAFGKEIQRTKTKNPEVVQRTVDWDKLEKSQDNEWYGINPNQRTILYGKEEAPVPSPSGLYEHGKDTDKNTSEKLNTWRPNVRFIQKNELDVNPGANKFGSLVAKFSRRGAETIDSLSHQLLTKSLWKKLLQLEQEIQQSMKEKKGVIKTPTMGVVGKNDCAAWALMLQKLIRESQLAEEKKKEESSRENASFDLDKDEAPPKPRTGDVMEHNLGAGSGSSYHGATAVAEDTSSLVTLEGHVEKKISVPEFHIRKGLSGFVEDNNEGERYREANKRTGTVKVVERSEGLSKSYKQTIDFIKGELSKELNEQNLLSLIRAYKVIFQSGGELGSWKPDVLPKESLLQPEDEVPVELNPHHAQPVKPLIEEVNETEKGIRMKGNQTTNSRGQKTEFVEVGFYEKEYREDGIELKDQQKLQELMKKALSSQFYIGQTSNYATGMILKVELSDLMEAKMLFQALVDKLKTSE
ncbi:hypothetical protein NIES2100_11450 [Calothrix sp. NIES-2100]|uniref:eCIS core domain-containing protein n=1 Tax=Calothrix sp. NIES-2100 TaxID=1954172 RepID=UPI000B618952|nr:hypothetical protein NIES2100_11450 [Calothrix sp. NIES-2100]